MLPDPGSMHEKLQQLLGYWESLKDGSADLPLDRRFDPVHIPTLLSSIYWLRVVGEPPRFQFRVVGESILSAGGPGRRGIFVDELPRAAKGPCLHDHLLEMVRTRIPNYYKGPPTLKHHSHVRQLEGILLPMRRETGAVSAVLCLTVYSWLDGQVT